jgi:hypothetical protein
MAAESWASVLIEVVKALPSIVTAVTAVIGVWIGARGLRQWREETIGKRKAELAEHALVDFYKARDAFSWARSRIAISKEGEERQALGPESKEVKEARDRYFIPIKRLRKENELFARLNAQRYIFAAYFGQGSSQPFDWIIEAHNEIISAASILVEMATDHMTPAMRQQDVPLLNIIGWGPDKRPDAIDRKIDESIEQIEQLCGPVLQSKNK